MQPGKPNGFALTALLVVMVSSALWVLRVNVELSRINQLEYNALRLDIQMKQLSVALSLFYQSACRMGPVSQSDDLVKRYIAVEQAVEYGDGYELLLSLENGQPISKVTIKLDTAFVHLARLAIANGASLDGDTLTLNKRLSVPPGCE